MIPVIIGAALAAGAGVGYALGKDDKPKPVVVNNVIQKAEVSEDYVKWQLDRARKDFSQSDEREQNNDAFESDFKRIDQMFTEDQDDNLIGHKLDELRLRARSQRDAIAMMKIADYYDKIYAYHRASLSREEAKTF